MMIVKTKLILFFLLTAATLYGQVYTVETVPDNKLINDSYVSNPDKIIQPGTSAKIDSVLRNLENVTGNQVAVVLLNSIGEADPFTFAQELFDSWKIGSAQNDNGLLVLLVKDKHAIRFHTGDGVEGILPDIICKRIQMEKMVPSFRENNYDEGIFQGILAVAAILTNPAAGDALALEEKVLVEDPIPLYGFTIWIILAWTIAAVIIFAVKKKRKTFAFSGNSEAVPHVRFTAGGWIFWYLFLPVTVMIALSISDQIVAFLGGVYVWAGVSLLARRRLMDQEAARWVLRKDYQTVYNFYQQEKGMFNAMRFLFPIPFAFMYGDYKKRMQFFRDHPRNCKQCGSPLSKLDEGADDEFLSKGQLLEEGLKSVDYDVWKCPACNAADKLTYINPSSKYSACPKCKVHAYFKVSDSVIRAATTSSEGTGEEIHGCKYCGERNVRRYSIARVQQSSTSSGSSSSSGGSSSGSSSSSGGSWGGGSSGGGGASSTW
jgi:uncharacterized protein